MRKFEIIEQFNYLHPQLPIRATSGSAGYDLTSIENVSIAPGEIKLIPTGLKACMPKNEVLLVYPRSSLAFKKSLIMSNSVGVIDSDYYNNPNNEGHIMIPLMNVGKHDVIIIKGERVAQGIFTTYQKTDDDTIQTHERKGGFGSSDH